MHEILDHLSDGSRVLDLGSRDGSFPVDAYAHLAVVRVDLKPGRAGQCSVQADAARLPFRSRSFDAVVLNHSLEHFAELKRALQEVGRVVRQDGAIYVAVPDARTLSDRLYRKVYRDAGGHVNLFGSENELRKMLAWYFGLPHAGTRVLCTSMAFWNARNTNNAAVKRQMRWPALREPLLAALIAACRFSDRRLRTRASVYGWAFYFGSVPEQVDPLPRTNVCVRCGQAYESARLIHLNAVRKWLWFHTYHCPDCSAFNFYTKDRDFFRQPARSAVPESKRSDVAAGS